MSSNDELETRFQPPTDRETIPEILTPEAQTKLLLELAQDVKYMKGIVKDATDAALNVYAEHQVDHHTILDLQAAVKRLEIWRVQLMSRLGE